MFRADKKVNNTGGTQRLTYLVTGVPIKSGARLLIASAIGAFLVVLTANEIWPLWLSTLIAVAVILPVLYFSYHLPARVQESEPPLTTVRDSSEMRTKSFRIASVAAIAGGERAIGLAVSVGGLFAMAIPPIVGAISDRLTTPIGRRRPVMIGATLLTLPGLLILATASSYPQIIIGYGWVQFFFNAAGAAFAGIIPDVVPAQRLQSPGLEF